MLRSRSVVPFVFAVALNPIVSADLLEITHTGFTVTIDLVPCDLARANGGSIPRKSSFTFDRDIEGRCQETATRWDDVSREIL